MNYLTVKEIEGLIKIEQILKYSRTLWYEIAEDFIKIPSSYTGFRLFISKFESSYFKGWQLFIAHNGSVILTRNISPGSLLIEIDRNGKQTYRLLPST